MTIMPVISLWQPFASLIFADRKAHETRSFRLPQRYVGRDICIHATAKFPPLRTISKDLHDLCVDAFGCSYNETLPQGAILGVVCVSACVGTEFSSWRDGDDRVSGDWAPYRRAWPLSDVRAFRAPIPAKGKQGWWTYDVPALSLPAPTFDQAVA